MKKMDPIKDFYRNLFEYNNFYNQQLADLILNNREVVTEKTIKLINHIINAHEIWNDRIRILQPNISPWVQRPLDHLRNFDNANLEGTTSILDYQDIENRVTYKTFKGELFSNRISDMLFHIVNHSTYHRAQIATEVKQQGIVPPATDYIFYKR
jgi:uncharacterized damage-inducible protein DinB